jgi:hypothetical protein
VGFHLEHVSGDRAIAIELMTSLGRHRLGLTPKVLIQTQASGDHSGTRSTYVFRLTHITFRSDAPGNYRGLCPQNWLRVGLFRKTSYRPAPGTLGKHSAWRMIAQRRIEQRCGAYASSYIAVNLYNNDDIGLLRPPAYLNAIP